MFTYSYICRCATAQVAVYWRVKLPDTPILTLDIPHAQTHIHLGTYLSLALPGVLLLRTCQSSCILEICLMMTHTYIHRYPRLIACANTHASGGAFFFHTCRSVFRSRMQPYTQLSYLFLQCGTNVLSRGCHIANGTVRHPGVERSFSSFNYFKHFKHTLLTTNT